MAEAIILDSLPDLSLKGWGMKYIIRGALTLYH